VNLAVISGKRDIFDFNADGIFYLFGLSSIRVICSVTGFSSKVDKATHYLILIGLILTIVLYTLKASVLYTVIIILI
jgi:hypothetical protein